MKVCSEMKQKLEWGGIVGREKLSWRRMEIKMGNGGSDAVLLLDRSLL